MEKMEKIKITGNGRASSKPITYSSDEYNLLMTLHRKSGEKRKPIQAMIRAIILIRNFHMFDEASQLKVRSMLIDIFRHHGITVDSEEEIMKMIHDIGRVQE